MACPLFCQRIQAFLQMNWAEILWPGMTSGILTQPTTVPIPLPSPPVTLPFHHCLQGLSWDRILPALSSTLLNTQDQWLGLLKTTGISWYVMRSRNLSLTNDQLIINFCITVVEGCCLGININLVPHSCTGWAKRRDNLNINCNSF